MDIFIILCLIIASNYVAYQLGKEKGKIRAYFEGRADFAREIEAMIKQCYNEARKAKNQDTLQ